MPATIDDVSKRSGIGNEISGRALKKRFSAGYKYILNNRPVILGLILVALLLFVYFANPRDLKDVIFNSWVAILSLIGLLYGAFTGKKKFDIQTMITAAIIFALITSTVLYFSPLLVALSAPMVEKLPTNLKETTTNFIELLKSGPESYIKTVLPAEFTKPKSEEPPQRTISAQFINPISRGDLGINVISKVGVRTKEDIELSIKCSLDGVEFDAAPSRISFTGSNNEQFASVTCEYPAPGDQLSLRITAPFEADAVLSVAVGEGDSLGRIRSTMISESPYSFTFDLLDTQPIGERDVPYPLYVKFFRDERNTKLVEIESLQIFPRSSRYQLSCLEPLKSLKFSGRKDEISVALLDKSKDAYGFICQLEVLNLPDRGIEKSVIEGKVKYTIEKEFKTSLSKYNK